MRTSTTAAVTDRRPAKLKGRRPRLALLAWTFPPAATVGSVRTWNLAKHLSRLGWDVTVVTPDPELLRFKDNVVKTNEALRAEGIHRILTGHRLRCLDPTLFNCWNRGLGWFLGGVSRRIGGRLGISRGIGWI